jgi:hypothetical protein
VHDGAITALVDYRRHGADRPAAARHQGMTVSLQWRAAVGSLFLLAVSAAYRQRSPIVSATALSATRS